MDGDQSRLAHNDPMLSILIAVPLAFAQQPAPTEASKSTGQDQKTVSDTRVELNLLGATDTSKGESKRNENMQFNLIDNNALRELNARLGTRATVVTEFRPELKYFGTEFGNAPVGVMHLDALRRNGSRPFVVHGALSYGHSNSIFSARSFFQVGNVLPARENTW